MPAKVLTAAAVARHQPQATRCEVGDGGCPGLRLMIEAAALGGRKAWVFRYRRPGTGKPAKLTLGSCNMGQEGADEPAIGGHLTLAAARRLAGAARHQLALGQDPGATHLAAKRERHTATAAAARNSFGTAAHDFIALYASKRTRRWPEQARLLGLQPKTLEVIAGGLAARWQSKPLAEITGHDIHLLLVEARERGVPGLERRSEGPTEARARAMLSALSRMFRWLLQHRRVETNPCAGVHRPEVPKSRDRVLTDPEIFKFWQATDALGAPFGPLLKLLLLTGCRLNEIAGLRWEELSDDGRALHLPGSRTKNHRAHVVPLTPLAQSALQSMQRIAGCDFVFSTTGRTPVCGWSKIKRRLDSLMGAVPPWRIHDLRRTAVTGMAELGIRPDVIEAAVNHVSGARAGVAGIYNRSTLLPERRAALERWAAHVHGLVSGGGAQVVTLRV